jgi:hypothetical protein
LTFECETKYTEYFKETDKTFVIYRITHNQNAINQIFLNLNFQYSVTIHLVSIWMIPNSIIETEYHSYLNMKLQKFPFLTASHEPNMKKML